MTIINEEFWTSNYLIYRLKEHLGTVPISDSHKTDLLDWYSAGHRNKVIDYRKYLQSGVSLSKDNAYLPKSSTYIEIRNGYSDDSKKADIRR